MIQLLPMLAAAGKMLGTAALGAGKAAGAGAWNLGKFITSGAKNLLGMGSTVATGPQSVAGHSFTSAYAPSAAQMSGGASNKQILSTIGNAAKTLLGIMPDDSQNQQASQVISQPQNQTVQAQQPQFRQMPSYGEIISKMLRSQRGF